MRIIFFMFFFVKKKNVKLLAVLFLYFSSGTAITDIWALFDVLKTRRAGSMNAPSARAGNGHVIFESARIAEELAR